MSTATVIGLTTSAVATTFLVGQLRPVRWWRDRQLDRGLRDLYGDTDFASDPVTWKSDATIRAEAALWKRAGYPGTAQGLLDCLPESDTDEP